MISIFNDNSIEKNIIIGMQEGGIARRNAEKKLYEYLYYLIKHGAKKYSISEDDAASAYSDTIISVIENIVSHKFEGRASLKSYTYQIFSNKCVDVVRKETTNKSSVNKTTALSDFLTLMPDTTKSIIQKIIDKGQQMILAQKLEEIGEKCKQLLLLFEDGYSDKEIAAIMLYNSSDVVKTSRLRCLEKLKKNILLN
jgi:RNA polymerase sigma factor (sigma-70 family)